jgi:membrane associated rhomboid family serine protease
MYSSFLNISNIVIVVTVLISLYALQNYSFLEKASFRPYKIKNDKEWWRWITNGFIHINNAHLFVNMLSLYFFGTNMLMYLQALIGDISSMLFLLFYVSAIAISGIYSYVKHKDDFGYSAVGASGAVSAVIFSCIMFDPFSKIYLYFAIGIPSWIFGLLYLYYEYYMGKRQMDNIGHDAHFSGAVYGLVFTVILYPQSITEFISHFTR